MISTIIEEILGLGEGGWEYSSIVRIEVILIPAIKFHGEINLIGVALVEVHVCGIQEATKDFTLNVSCINLALGEIIGEE